MSEQTITEDVEADNPLVEGDTLYTVRLVFQVSANSPEHARGRFIAQLNEFGLNTWTYRVTESLGAEDNEFFVRDGEVMTPEEFAAKEEAEENAELDGYVLDDETPWEPLTMAEATATETVTVTDERV